MEAKVRAPIKKDIVMVIAQIVLHIMAIGMADGIMVMGTSTDVSSAVMVVHRASVIGIEEEIIYDKQKSGKDASLPLLLSESSLDLHQLVWYIVAYKEGRPMNKMISELWHGNIVPQNDARNNSKEMKELMGYIVDYNGIRCTAIFNVFTGTYYADDKFGVIKN